MADFTPVIDTSPSRILIVEHDASMLESLGSLSHDMPEIDFDRCTSRDHALGKVLASPYNVIISGVHLAELDDFYFLKQNKAHQPSVPVVVTAKASEKESAYEALRQGAFDVIGNPLDPAQSRITIRLALWQDRLLKLLASKERPVEKIRRHLAQYPLDKKTDDAFKRSLLSIEKTIDAYQQTIERAEETIKLFADIVIVVQNQTRKRALDHLDTLCREVAKAMNAVPRPKVLIVDDDPQDLESWATSLREAIATGSVLTARSAGEALDVCRNQEIDCVILDLDLGDSSGFEVLLGLNPNRERPTKAVVVLTRLMTPNLHEMTLHHGAQACLIKQRTSSRELRECIRKAIDSIATHK